MAMAAKLHSREQSLQGLTPNIPLSFISSELSPVRVPQPLSQKFGKGYLFSDSEISGAWDGSWGFLGKESLT